MESSNEKLGMYEFCFTYDGEKEVVLLPIAPSKLTLKIGNSNKTIDLVSMGETTIIKDIGLREYSFKFLIPSGQYRFARYPDGFKEPLYYLNKFRGYKEDKKPVRFLIYRNSWESAPFETNILVTLEEYTVEEIAGQEGDFWIDMRLKEYRPYKVRELVEVGKNPVTGAAQVIEIEHGPSRPIPKTYTVKSGDTLWRIAKMQLNDETKHRYIADLNGIKGNKIYPGQVLKLK